MGLCRVQVSDGALCCRQAVDTVSIYDKALSMKVNIEVCRIHLAEHRNKSMKKRIERRNPGA